MWLIVGTIFCTILYTSLYSVILFIWGDASYCYIVKTIWLHSFWTIFSRSIQLVIWFYPIIWLFWPPGMFRTIKKPKQSLPKKNVNRDSINQEQDEEDTPTEYGSEMDNKSSNSYINMY